MKNPNLIILVLFTMEEDEINLGEIFCALFKAQKLL
jgi:hypothetical protein